jgi:replicative DNA helicase
MSQTHACPPESPYSAGQPNLPYSREAEEAVLGSILINPEIYDELAAFLQAGDFYIVRLRWIWEACARLKEKRIPIDSLTVSETLDDLGRLAEVGGPAYLTALLNQVPTTLHAESYGRIIQADSLRRRLLLAANTIAQLAYDQSLEVEQVMTLSDKALNDAQDQATARENLNIGQILSGVYDYAVERQKNPGRVWGMSTGFPDWDKLTGGLHRGQTTIISAPPGSGKTTLVMQVARNVAAKHGVVVHELEMDRRDLGIKTFAAECGITTNEINSGYIPASKWQKMAETLENFEYPKSRMVINDTPGITTAQLRANVARLVRQMDIGLLVVDYVNLLSDHDTRDENENTALKLRRLRDIAREFNLALLTIQSMTKEGMDDNAAPKLNAMRGPADLQFDADSVFFMVQDKKLRKTVHLNPAKLRHGNGERTPFDLLWDPTLPKFNSVLRLP